VTVWVDTRFVSSHAFEPRQADAPVSAPRAHTRQTKPGSAGAESGLRPSTLPVQRDAWRADSDLWYFGGEPSNGPLPTEVTLRASSAGGGRYDWNVLAGADKVELGDADDPTHSEARDDNRVRVRSKAGSAGVDDVHIGVAHRSDNGNVTRAESSLGVRNPVGMRVSPSGGAPASFPDTYDVGPVEAGGDEATQEKTADETQTVAALPDAAPKSLTHKGTDHNTDPTYMYETHENYETLDDKGATMKGYDVNELFTTTPTNDAPKCDWRRGPAGGRTVSGTAWFDRMQGEDATKTPTPQNPGTPLGSTKVQHWNQEWYIGSKDPGKGTKVQTNVFQKYQDHANHESIKSPP
jgi:hypothetical protein